jgi:sensor histidine kinase YesM
MLGFVVQNRICRHILFWVVSFYYLLHFFLIGNEVGTIDYIYTVVFHLPLMVGVYANLCFGMPVLLGRKRYWQYCVFLMLLLLVTVVANRVLFDYVIDYLAPGYFFVSDLSWYELLQFEVVYVGLTLLISLSGSWFALQESRNRLVRLEKEKIDAELSFLKGQINPHFLFNSLNNIYSLVLKKDAYASVNLLKLSSVMRYMIYESNGDFVALDKEIAYISDYIELQRLRVREQSGIRFHVEGGVVGRKVAPLVFIVFIENAFKHGGVASGYEVDIFFNVAGDRLLLCVENVKGIVDEVVSGEYKGLGIANVRRRLDLIYPERYALTIEDGAERYRVELAIPLLAV